MLVQRVRALRWQPPQPHADIFAAGALQIIRVRNFHQVGRPPAQVLWFDEVITLNRLHGRGDSKLARQAAFANFSLRSSTLSCFPVFLRNQFDVTIAWRTHELAAPRTNMFRRHEEQT